MPRLEAKEEIIRLALPSTEKEPIETDRAWVDLDIGPLTANDVILVDPSGTDVQASFAMLAVRIKDWNFEDDAGKLPINPDTVSQLDIVDYGFLSSKLPQPKSGLPVDQKKTLS